VNNLSISAKVYIFSIILIGLALGVWQLSAVDLGNPGLYLLAILAAGAQILKLEGPNDRTNYNIASFVFGFTLITLGSPATLFVILVAHLAEWAWHKYPWFIQSFNLTAYAIVVTLSNLVFQTIKAGSNLNSLDGALAIAAALLIFVLSNHLLVGWVIKLARGQSFKESGVFSFMTLVLDFTVLGMGASTALIWFYNPFASLLNVVPLYLLYNALRVPALRRQVEIVKTQKSPAI
jgi:hypothetical protein